MHYFEISGTVQYYLSGVEQHIDITSRLDAADKESAMQHVLDNLAEELAAREEVSIAEPGEISDVKWVNPPTVRVLTDTCLE
jgi:hypothetical protein